MALGSRCPSAIASLLVHPARSLAPARLTRGGRQRTMPGSGAAQATSIGGDQPPAAGEGAPAVLQAGEGAGAGGAAHAAEPQFTVVSEEVVHKRYMTLYNRKVQFPSSDGQSQGPVHEYDVVGHASANFHFTVVFPYHSVDDTVTLIREYGQASNRRGLNQMVWCLPSGAFDPRKHASYEACAKAELSEEARLAGGTWEPLIPEQHPGIAEVKWCRNRFHSYLCMDPEQDAQPGSRDQEEFIEVRRVSVPELRQLMLSGDMLLPSVATCFIALERIQQRRQQQQQQ